MPATLDNRTLAPPRRFPHTSPAPIPIPSNRRSEPQLGPPARSRPTFRPLSPSRPNTYLGVDRLRVPERPIALPRQIDRAPVRALDLLGSAIGLVVALPLMAVVALAIRLTTDGPAFFVHRRVGRSGRLFPCLKFRSMWPDAEARLEHLLADHPELRAEWDRNHKLRDDPRITPIGAFLRKTNLDELPQLVNVLLGQMSLVGPRPVTAVELERYGNDVVTVLSVKPGLTGLWQISGRSDLTYDERVVLDVTYVQQRTLRSDLVICLKTVLATVHPSTDGAY